MIGVIELTVVREYPGRHHYIEIYSLTDLCCPKCGSMSCVWEEGSRGDYYCGPDNLCTHCGASFTIQLSNEADAVTKSVIDQLKSGKAITPTTKKGN